MQKPVALITGASRSIGRGIADQLAHLKFDIVIDDVFEEKQVQHTIDLIRKNGVDVLYIRADISKSHERQTIIDQIKNKFGRLDILVNNAGVAPSQRLDILEATEESYDRVMNINLKGPYFLTQLAANWMIEQKKQYNERQYYIVNLASISSYTSSPARGEYCLSKAGISMMTKLYADRLAEFGILVYEIRPGVIATDMTKVVKDKYDRLIHEEGLLPIKRWGESEDVGKAVAAIALGFLPYSTGQVINVDGGFHIQRL
ncbi:3-ketoacyl-ACP reductase [candidate division KSB1 bacterium]|nr:3-ketoacyl-ACP reductase [candidate division KSB1 bacterium]